MCGISGGIGKSAPTKPELLEILERIKHRGPDSSGVYSNSHVTLGNCRLEIVEIKDGAQPFTSSDNNVTVVFNGKITIRLQNTWFYNKAAFKRYNT